MTKSLAELSGGVTGNYAGYQFGQSIANQILALRANDGSNNNAAYIPPAGNYVWRPGSDGFALGPNWGSVAETVSDPTWRPLLDNIKGAGTGTPPFPDYISGHSTFSGAWAGVLSRFFGANYNFSAVSQELTEYSSFGPNAAVRSYSGTKTFQKAAREDALSRVYGGVHVREATETDALPLGTSIGEFAANFFLNT